MDKRKRSYRVEWIALAVMALGVALLFDWTPVMAVVDSVVVGVARQLTFATLLGLTLICGGLVFIGWRGRARFLRLTVLAGDCLPTLWQRHPPGASLTVGQGREQDISAACTALSLRESGMWLDGFTAQSEIWQRAIDN